MINVLNEKVVSAELAQGRPGHTINRPVQMLAVGAGRKIKVSSGPTDRAR